MLGVVACDGLEPLAAIDDFVHAALIVKAFESSAYVAARELFDDLPQVRIPLPHDLVQSRDRDPGLLELLIRPAGVHGLVLPGITDSPRQLQAVVKAAAEAGAVHIYANPLFLKPCSAAVFLPFLQENFPHLVPEYERRFKERAFLPSAYRKRISQLISSFRQKYGIVRETQWEKPEPKTQPQMRLF